MTKTKKVRKVKAWAGIEGTEIGKGWLEWKDYKDTCHGIFSTEQEAKTHYERVVPCEITYKV